MIVASWDGWTENISGQKETEVEEQGQTVSAANTMITLPSNFSLPLLHALLQSSGRNVAQIRVSVCWGG